MIKIFNILSYYILLLLGLIGSSWIIWARFIRQRTIREIPDVLLTEYRFWILLYICFIYIYSIKNLLKEPSSHIIYQEINKINKYIWKPLMTLDHAIKYNNFCKNYYINFILNADLYWTKLSDNSRTLIIISFQIIPRMILVIFLIADTFYFNKLEIFYKIILIGILPFMFRYISYSLKDIYDHWVKQLTDVYSSVTIFEKGYNFKISRIGKTEAVWHYDIVSIEDYIEIKYDADFDYLFDKVSYEYVGYPSCKEEVYIQYELKFNKPVSSWTPENREEVYHLFEELMPKILNLKGTLNNLQILKKERKIVWPKIIIYLLYFICWSYILIISYYYYPITLTMFNYLINNIQLYLTMEKNPFIDDMFSQNINMITPQSIYNLIKMIIIVIINKRL